MHNNSVPQVHLPPHITGEEDPEELDIHFDDISSTHEIVQKTEEPGIDSLRGTFGAIGTIIRAKRRARALSAASHAQSELSQRTSEELRSRCSTNYNSGRPSWLNGPWSTPKGSRFQPMELPETEAEHDVEKGQMQVFERRTTLSPLGDNQRSARPSPSAQPRTPSPSPPAPVTSPNTIQLHPFTSSQSVTSGAITSSSESGGSSEFRDNKFGEEENGMDITEQ